MASIEESQFESSVATQDLRLPDFFIIGAAKSGTTTLYKYLCRHPEVFMSTPKEMSYFSKDEVYQRGIQWYANLFTDAGDHQDLRRSVDHLQSLADLRQDGRAPALRRSPMPRSSIYSAKSRSNACFRSTHIGCARPLRQPSKTLCSRRLRRSNRERYMTQIRQYLEVFPESQLLVHIHRRRPRPTAVDLVGRGRVPRPALVRLSQCRTDHRQRGRRQVLRWRSTDPRDWRDQTCALSRRRC